MHNRWMVSLGWAGLLLALADGVAARDKGVPDLSGTYDIATVTPLQRPQELGDTLTLSDEQAQAVAARVAAAKEAGLERSDPNREAPPAGGDGSAGAAGNVGGYNSFWIDNGDTAIRINGEYRTSIIVDPKNGRYPAMTPTAQQKMARFFAQFRQNTGEAWWLGQQGPGPYDDPEGLTLSDRCLLGFGSSAGPPTLPVLYNNLKRIVQTENYVMILNEMVHDARIIRLNSEHADPSVRKWLGDSIGWWEGDTLVVDSVGFNEDFWLDRRGLPHTERLHTIERFTRTDKNTIDYKITVDDPGAYTAPFDGGFNLRYNENQELFEYVCQQANYAHELMVGGESRVISRSSQIVP